jgi:hypothetical protein
VCLSIEASSVDEALAIAKSIPGCMLEPGAMPNFSAEDQEYRMVAVLQQEIDESNAPEGLKAYFFIDDFFDD